MTPILYPELPKEISPSHFPAIAGNWNHSAQLLTKVSAALKSRLSGDDVVVAVAGSMGRLDASEHLSDFDYLVLLENDSVDGKLVHDAAKDVAMQLHLPEPNPAGAFAQPITVQDLIATTGADQEPLTRMAKRLLLLMESKPIYNEVGFNKVIDKILTRYLNRVTQDASKQPLFLLNDIIRYFRGICVNYEFNFFKETDKWGLRYVKLLHSRVIMYSGLLFLVLNSSKKAYASNKASYIRQHIELTPLEKLLHVYADNDDNSHQHLLGIYNIFLSKLNDGDLRKQLNIEFPDRHHSEVYRELRVTGDALRKELMRFLFSRRGTWSDSVFEYLVF